MDQEDINDLIAKNPSPEAKLNDLYRDNGYSRNFVIQTVSLLFRKYSSDHTLDALQDLNKMLKSTN